jgi:sporulation protein YlmC with PRC-barrel domain
MSVDLSGPIKEICSRLGVEYGLVSEIVLRPLDAQVRQLKVNERGAKYVEQETGEVADETLTFEINS